MSFTAKTYFAFILATGLSIGLSFVIVWWIHFPLFAVSGVVFYFLQCNNCGHNVAGDAKGDGRIVTNFCAKCGASLEGVYPFSYRRRQRGMPPS
jgi:hypothetical protein